MVLSLDPETTRVPQDEKLHELTTKVWPFNVFKSVPEKNSQIFTVLSQDPETIKLSQGEKLHQVI